MSMPPMRLGEILLSVVVVSLGTFPSKIAGLFHRKKKDGITKSAKDRIK